MPNHGRQRPRGFTLLELLIVASLMCLVTMMTAAMWRHVTAQTSNLKNRSVAAQELRMALDCLAADMGSVITAVPDDNRLLITRETADNPAGVLVEYYQQGSQLWRYDHAGGVRVPLVNCIETFAARDLSPSLLSIGVTVTSGDISRQATVFWSRT